MCLNACICLYLSVCVCLSLCVYVCMRVCICECACVLWGIEHKVWGMLDSTAESYTLSIPALIVMNFEILKCTELYNEAPTSAWDITISFFKIKTRQTSGSSVLAPLVWVMPLTLCQKKLPCQVTFILLMCVFLQPRKYSFPTAVLACDLSIPQRWTGGLVVWSQF